MKRLAISGLVIWAAATIALRLWGQFIFRRVDAAAALSLLLISLPLMIATGLALLRPLPAPHRPLGAIVVVAPGMLLDTVSSVWFATVFPNIRPDAAGLFGGWLLFCNVVVLLTSLMPAAGASASKA